MTTTSRPTVSRPTTTRAGDRLVVVPAPWQGALATPWSGSLVRPPVVAPVRFSDLPVAHAVPVSGAGITLETPWQAGDLRRPTSTGAVDFRGLAAPIAPAVLPSPRVGG